MFSKLFLTQSSENCNTGHKSDQNLYEMDPE